MVARKRSYEKHAGRGFSRGELKEAGITARQALKIAVEVDTRRRSVHGDNVDLLKTRLQSLAAAEKHVSKARKARKVE